MHLSVPKQVLLGLLGSSLISRSHIDNSSIYCFVVFPTVLLCFLSPMQSKPKHPHNKQFHVMLRTFSLIPCLLIVQYSLDDLHIQFDLERHNNYLHHIYRIYISYNPSHILSNGNIVYIDFPF